MNTATSTLEGTLPKPSARQPSDHKGSPKDMPYDAGWPILGHTIGSVVDPVGLSERLKKKHGQYLMFRSFGQTIIPMTSPEANEFALLDKENVFSSEGGWDTWIGKLFPRGLMLMDFTEHRHHRKMMNVAFKTEPMKLYLETLNDHLPSMLAKWEEKGKFHFYPAVKQLTLDVATRVFLGLEPGPASAPVNKALTDMVTASVAIVRAPLPFTKMRWGLKGRAYMSAFIKSEIPKRRAGSGQDMFSLLCRAEADDGTRFSDQEIVDHMNFLWMAAHDTVTSSMTTLAYQLGRHPEWQDRLREEITGLGMNDERLQYDMLAKMELADCCFKEALRINPPVPMMPRKVLKDTEFHGYRIPKGSIISVSPLFTHRSETIWDNPLSFDPMRFTPDAQKQRHRYSWIPYGGGAHMCLGLHFAVMQAKAILAHLLPRYELSLDGYDRADFQIMPLIKPKRGLPVTLKTREASQT